MNFITIDFETATSDRNSPCEIGLTFVENNQIIKTKSWLIKPQQDIFNAFNTYIHGITWNDVADKPEFDEIWKEIHPLIENKFLIAHNANFDMSVLRKTLETYQIPFPNLTYSCSYLFSKNIWKNLPSYDLKTLCKINNIDFKHHKAGDDSLATAKLTLKAFEIAKISSMEDFPNKLSIIIGKLNVNGYFPSKTNSTKFTKIPKEITGDPSKHNLESIFYNTIVVFTGTLSSMVRSEAQQIIADIGGINGKSVSKSTDYLIVGQQDYRVVGDDGMSNKQEKAIQLIKNGSSLEILSEDDFLRNI